MPHFRGQPHIGLAGAEEALQAGLQGGLTGLAGGIGFAEEQLDPFVQPGQQAGQLQAAFSGGLGPAAQAQAFADFQQSPGQQFLQERGQQNLLRNQAAIGGLGGGNVRQELVRQGIGFAQGDLQRQLQQLSGVAGRGLSGAQQLGGLGAQAGAQAGQFGIGTGTNLANLRTRAGEQIAQNISGTTSGLAQLISQEGSGLSDIIGQGGGNLANILAEFGRQQGLSQEQLAQLLANVSQGQATTAAGLPAIGGLVQPSNTLSNIQQLTGGIGTLLSSLPQQQQQNPLIIPGSTSV